MVIRTGLKTVEEGTELCRIRDDSGAQAFQVFLVLLEQHAGQNDSPFFFSCIERRVVFHQHNDPAVVGDDVVADWATVDGPGCQPKAVIELSRKIKRSLVRMVCPAESPDAYEG